MIKMVIDQHQTIDYRRGVAKYLRVSMRCHKFRFSSPSLPEYTRGIQEKSTVNPKKMSKSNPFNPFTPVVPTGTAIF